MRYRILIVLSVLAVLGFWTVGPASDSAMASEQEETTPDATVPKKIPDEARSTQNPVKPSEQSLKDGEMIYSSQCAMCHGVAGDGKGKLVERFHYQMPDFTDAGFHGTRTDGEIYYVLTHGHGKMRGQGDRFKSTTRWNLINYVRSFRPEP